MVIFYNTIIYIFSILFRVSRYFNGKSRLFVEGRNGLLEKLKTAFKENANPVVWIHCASVGEFEQARPLIEALKQQYQHHKILLTFFSPSGYELRKNYSLADWVFYLPWDTPKNASLFVKTTQPSLAIFIKYEFWIHYTNQLHRQSIPIFSVASIFREDQLFFQWYGEFYRSVLKKFTHFFVQNYESQTLLKSVGIEAVTVSGDTRFDRVNEIVRKSAEIPLANFFKNNEKLLVAGSIWPEDLETLVPFINEHAEHIKFILAPHEISESNLIALEKLLRQKHIRFSQANVDDIASYKVLIIDNVGMLSTLYRYGEFAFVGGAFGKGLHNILEAACYGVPIFFGNKKFEKFQEAKDLINRGGAFSVKDYPDLQMKFEQVTIPENFLLACEVNRSYVEENLGATEKVINHCNNILAQ